MKRIPLFVAIISILIVYRSIAQWQEINNGLWGATVNTIVVKDNIIYAGTYGGLYKSEDDGKQWREMGVENSSINTVLIKENKILVGTADQGIFVSNDNGDNWIQANNGFDTDLLETFVLYQVGNNILTGKRDGIFYSTDDGSRWIQAAKLNYVYCFASNKNRLYAGTLHGMYVSVDNGKNWILKGNIDASVYSIITVNDTIFAATLGNGILASTDQGESWTQKNYGLSNLMVVQIAQNNAKLYAFTMGGGLYVSSNHALSWFQKNNNIVKNTIYSVGFKGNEVIAGGDIAGIYFSSDEGENWINKSSGMTNVNAYQISKIGTNLIAGVYGIGFFVSSDDGTHWEKKNNGLDRLDVCTILAKENTIYLSTYNGGLYRSTDVGENWTKINSWNTNFAIWSMAYKDSMLVAATNLGGVYFSTDNGDSWSKRSLGMGDTTISTVVFRNDELFAGTINGLYSLAPNTDSWHEHAELANVYVKNIFNAGSILYAGSMGYFLYYSTDGGTNWRHNYQFNNELVTVQAIASQSNNIFVGTLGKGILYSSDYTKFDYRNKGLKSKYIFNLFMEGDYLYAGTSGGVYKSKYSDLITDVTEGAFLSDIISLYPNPARSDINIRLGEDNISEKPVAVYDIQGNKVIEGLIISGNSSLKINLDALPTGMYFININNKIKSFIKY